MTKPSIFALAALVLGLGACTDMGGESLTADTSGAEQACIARVNANNGASSGAEVTSSDMTGTGSTVNLVDQNGTSWRCQATSDGTVGSLTAIT
jgi:hypothetical protein